MEEIKKLLQKNLEYSKLNHEMLLKVRRYILIQQIFSVLKIVIIVIPLVLAMFYALPFLKESLLTYQNILSEFDKATGGTGGTQNILQQILK
jgi:hypothetical protein